ncbi:MAG: hypothetical protein ABW224_20030 [Kibdelosporangium sp.]
MATADPGAAKTSVAPAGEGSGLKFSQCVRDQGFPWFPDPGPDGGLQVSVPEGTDQAKFKKAEETCKVYAPGAGQNGGKLGAEDLDKVRQVSQCMRDNGFPKYPDPDATGSITIESSVLGVEPDDPAFQKAMQACQKYLPPRKSGGNS